MKKTMIVATLSLVSALGAIGGAAAQVAGTTTIGVSKTEVVQLALGWSVRQSILGQHVYTEAGEKMDKHIATLQQDLKAAEDKLAEMKHATAKKWKSFEAGVNSATDRMRKSLAAAIA